jgi:hypothetical protein
MGHITFTPGLEFDEKSHGLPARRAVKAREPVSVLLEMRPALDGFAGIPQETRLLFRGLRLLTGVRLQGLIQHPVRRLARGTRAKARAAHASMPPARALNRYSRVIVSLAERPFKTVFDKIRDLAQKGFANAELCFDDPASHSHGASQRLRRNPLC